MQILSAFDAISPAFARTKLVLYTPFRKGRTWKLAATGWICAYGSVFLPFPLLMLAFIPVIKKDPTASAAVPILIGVALLLSLIYFLIFYLCSRLRFAFFDIVLNRGEFVAPAWRKYGSQSLKWSLFKVLLGTAFTAGIALPIWHIGKGMITDFSSFQVPPGTPPSPEMMRTIFSFYAAFFLIYIFVGLFFFLSSVLSDFVIPSLALEDTSFAEAFRRVGLLVRNEPGQVTLYCLLKIGLFLAVAMAAGVCFYIVLFVLILAAVVVGGLIGLLLHLLHVPTAVLAVLAVVCGIVIYLGFIGYCMPIAYGTVSTFFESYALNFLGGRYPMLGDLLTASTPPPAPTRGPLYPNPYPPYSAPPSPADQ